MREGWWRRFVGSELTWAHGAWMCVLSGLALALLGLYAIEVGSAQVPGIGGSGGGGTLVVRQSVYLLVGVVAAALVALPHYRLVRWIAWPLMWLMLGLLVFVLIPWVPSSIVAPRNGARCWIQLGPADFQPSEVAKICFVLVMADYLRHRQNHRTFGGLMVPAMIALVPAALITMQPDLGMAMLFVPVTFAMLLAAGAKLKHLSIVVLCAMLAAPAAYPLLRPHQKARIDGMIARFTDPEKGADGVNFQALTAQTLSGAGELAGVTASKARALVRFNRLPERHNDMILAVIMARFGLVGGLGVLTLYAMWFAGAYISAATCRDPFGRLVIVGLMAMLFAQAFVNIAMNVGIMPIVGLTLPFVSYGGSSMLAVWVITGLVFSIAMRRPMRLARPTFEFDDTPYDPIRPSSAHRILPGAGVRRG